MKIINGPFLDNSFHLDFHATCTVAELRRGYRSSFFIGLATAHTLADLQYMGGGGGPGEGPQFFCPADFCFLIFAEKF